MKKLFLSLLSCTALSAFAQNKSVYDLDAFAPELLELFSKVEAEDSKVKAQVSVSGGGETYAKLSLICMTI